MKGIFVTEITTRRISNLGKYVIACNRPDHYCFKRLARECAFTDSLVSHRDGSSLKLATSLHFGSNESLVIPF